MPDESVSVHFSSHVTMELTNLVKPRRPRLLLTPESRQDPWSASCARSCGCATIMAIKVSFAARLDVVANSQSVENARNLSTKENIPLTMKHYLKHMTKLTEQFFDGSDGRPWPTV